MRRNKRERKDVPCVESAVLHDFCLAYLLVYMAFFDQLDITGQNVHRRCCL